MTITRAALIQWALLAASARTATAAADALATVRFISPVADDMRPFLYAQSAGLFRQAGLDVVMERAATGAAVAQAIAGGAMDVGKSSITSVIAAYSRGLPFVLVAPGQLYRKENPTSGIVVAQNSPLRTLLDLQGKIVACTALGDIGYLGLRALIDVSGGDSSTVRWLELPLPAVSAAVEQGRVDAGLMAEPHMMQEVRAGKVRYFVDMLAGYGRPILEVAYVSTRDYATKNRETVAGFANAMERAAAYCNSHVAQTLPLLVSYTGMDPKEAAEMRQPYAATSFNPAQIQPVIDLAARYKSIPHGFDARELMATVIN